MIGYLDGLKHKDGKNDHDKSRWSFCGAKTVFQSASYCKYNVSFLFLNKMMRNFFAVKWVEHWNS